MQDRVSPSRTSAKMFKCLLSPTSPQKIVASHVISLKIMVSDYMPLPAPLECDVVLDW
jgi:hypothetical protein